MSWLLLNIVLVFEVVVVVLVARYARMMLIFLTSIREWLIPLSEDFEDIKTELVSSTSRAAEDIVPMLRHFKYVAITGTLAVVHNMLQQDIVVWVPFWASLLFTFQSLNHLYKINIMGDYFNTQLDRAEEEVNNRMWLGGILDQVQEVEAKHNEENS